MLFGGTQGMDVKTSRSEITGWHTFSELNGWTLKSQQLWGTNPFTLLQSLYFRTKIFLGAQRKLHHSLKLDYHANGTQSTLLLLNVLPRRTDGLECQVFPQRWCRNPACHCLPRTDCHFDSDWDTHVVKDYFTTLPMPIGYF